MIVTSFKNLSEIKPNLHTDIEFINNLQNHNVKYDLVNKYMTTIDFNHHQRQGRDPSAGMKHSSRSTPANRDSSRLPRGNIGNKGFGGQRVIQVPNAVGGRQCFPSVVEKRKRIKMNKKERASALLNLFAHHIQECILTNENSVGLADYSQIKVKEITTKTVCFYNDVSEIRHLRNNANVTLINTKNGALNRLYNLGPINKGWAKMLFSDIALTNIVNKFK